MVIKICKICGKEFDARGYAKCCSPECSKINRKALCRKASQKWREANPEYKKQWREANPEYEKQWREANPEYQKQWCEANPEKRREYARKYYENNRDEILEKTMLRQQNIISELCEQYDGDLERILENIPSEWQVREAQMCVWFGKSYLEGIIAKIKSTPVCEVTGESNDLVIHHLYSFNTHPELGNDPENMVRITTDIHKKFHSIYGYGDNTPEQWFEFIENL